MAERVTSERSERDRCDVAFAGGGTAGHVFPGLAVAEELGRRIIWIGSSGGVEKTLVGRPASSSTASRQGSSAATFH
jgi:UDP-N-acetylglucosamine:LPS N-acetylglucosamine transferase